MGARGSVQTRKRASESATGARQAPPCASLLLAPRCCSARCPLCRPAASPRLAAWGQQPAASGACCQAPDAGPRRMQASLQDLILEQTDLLLPPAATLCPALPAAGRGAACTRDMCAWLLPLPLKCGSFHVAVLLLLLKCSASSYPSSCSPCSSAAASCASRLMVSGDCRKACLTRGASRLLR